MDRVICKDGARTAESKIKTDELVILLYHGVTRGKSSGAENYSGKHISEENFVSQMRFIKANHVILSMDDVMEIKKNGDKYPSEAVAVTFDDGFKNNNTVAAPILDDLKIPATFYISSGVVGTDLMFWVDKIEDCVNLAKKKTIKLVLDKTYEFKLNDNEGKIHAIERIKGFCRNSHIDAKNRVVQELIEGTGVLPDNAHAENYAKLNWKELRQIADSDLFVVGGHSMYHDILSRMDPDKMEEDIDCSIDLLEGNLGCKVVHYSYPEGQKDHYNERVVDVLKRNGIACCPSAVFGTNDDQVDLFNLRRCMVGFKGTEFPLFQ